MIRSPFRYSDVDPKELVELRELLMANTIPIDSMYQLLIQKGYFTEADFWEKLRADQRDYQEPTVCFEYVMRNQSGFEPRNDVIRNFFPSLWIWFNMIKRIINS